jgi:hypothetical protein
MGDRIKLFYETKPRSGQESIACDFGFPKRKPRIILVSGRVLKRKAGIIDHMGSGR